MLAEQLHLLATLKARFDVVVARDPLQRKRHEAEGVRVQGECLVEGVVFAEAREPVILGPFVDGVDGLSDIPAARGEMVDAIDDTAVVEGSAALTPVDLLICWFLFT